MNVKENRAFALGLTCGMLLMGVLAWGFLLIEPAPADAQIAPALEVEVNEDAGPGAPEGWEFTVGETIVCGQDAKPAIDHRDDAIGWWAYCEPALVDE